MRRPSYLHRGGDRPLIGRPIYDYLADTAKRVPEHEAIVSCQQGIRWTYRELFERIEDLAKGLVALGIGRGTRVGIWSTDNAEWLLLQLATARIGAVLVNINPAYRPAELEHALSAARIEALFLMPEFKSSKYVEMLRSVCPELDRLDPDALSCNRFPELRRVVLFDPDRPPATRPAPGFFRWEEVIEQGRTVSDEALRDAEAKIDADDPINIQFTSGTTGFPKPVVLTHHNILNNAYSVGAALGTSPNDRLCVPLPFYHCFGMVISNLATFAHGATLVIPSPHFDPAAVLEAIEAERCTIVHGVPTMFVALLDHEDFSERDLSTLRTGIMAGAPCPPELMERVIDDMGVDELLIAYGQTEASPATHITKPSDSFERRIRTVGTNMPHQEVKVIDPETGRTVPIGTQGEVCFRGYHVMRGYFDDQTATREAIDASGWLHSGDLGVMDEDGYLAITGRLKEMVIRGGENIYPAEIEAYLATHPKIAQSAVFGVPDEKWGEELGAWIQLHPGETGEPEDFRKYIKDGMAYFKVPRHIRIVDDFPMTVTGKIQKFRIRELMESELATSASQTVPVTA